MAKETGKMPRGVGAASDVGMQRELNEDNLRWGALADGLCLFAVADGMGGHESGEVASQLAIQTLFEAADRFSDKAPGGAWTTEEIEALLRNAFREANNAVVETARARASNMGTTLVGLLTYNHASAIVANVGDSRCYLLRGGTLRSVSQDHSLVAYLVQLGEITEEQARVHPSGNILVRSVGSTQDVETDVFPVALQPGDRFLLCSDGLWGEVPNPLIEKTLATVSDADACCRALIRAANDAGGKDNITCIVVDI
jgi:protein phosphatase